MSDKKKPRQTTHNDRRTEAPPPGYDSWQAFDDEFWNAGLERPRTRTFRIVGNELHEIPKEEAAVRPGGREERARSEPAGGSRLRFVKVYRPPQPDPISEDSWHLSYRGTDGSTTYEDVPVEPDEIARRVDELVSSFTDTDVANLGGRDAIEGLMRVLDLCGGLSDGPWDGLDEVESDEEGSDDDI